MACPSSGTITLYGIAKELEINNYYNTIPYGTYDDYYVNPPSLTNMSTGGGGFDSINTANSSANRPNGSTPHYISEFYSYDHDKVSASAPTVQTSGATWKSNTSSILMMGSVTSNGGATLTEKGFVYSSSTSSPTIGGSGVTKKTVSGTSTGIYSTSVAGSTLTIGPFGTTYYVRAFAKNSVGTSYGSSLSVFVPGSISGGGGGGGSSP